MTGDGVIAPVVRTHPVTGRKGLYVNSIFTKRCEHMSVDDSVPLLQYLFTHMQKHDFTCRFRWQTTALEGDTSGLGAAHTVINRYTGQLE